MIENLLYAGAYILAEMLKIGKSFLVAQMAHHVSTGQNLWSYKVHQGTVLYLALEDDESRLQRQMFRIFGVKGPVPSFSPPASEWPAAAWMNRWKSLSGNTVTPSSLSWTLCKKSERR